MPNTSILTLPVFYFLTMVPHVYSVRLLSSHQPKAWDNSNPRSVDAPDKYRKILGSDKYATYERARACHANGFEFFPFAAAAILSANYVGLPEADINFWANTLVAIRVAYVWAYISISTKKASYLRSLMFTASSGICGYLLIKSGLKAMNA